MLLRLTDINKFYNGNQVLSHVSLTIEDRDRIGLIGVNGCGKSTLLRIITEHELPDHLVEGDGDVAYSGKTSIGYLEQMGGLNRESTVWEEMRSVFQPLLDTQEKMHALEEQMQSGDLSVSEEYHRLQTWFEANDGYQIDVKIRTVLNGMGFGRENDSRIISGFSGGEKTRLAIARLLLEEPNLLILDEPTNHLDFKTVMWLEDYLKDYKGALLLVSHDRYFLDRLCTSICEIEQGTLTQYKGNYTTFTQLKEAAVARQWKEYEMQQKEIAKLEDYVARNLTRASTAKSAQSRVKQLEKMERIPKPLRAQKQALLPVFKEPLHYKMTEEGVEVSQKETQQFQKWEDMYRAVSTGKSLILYTDKIHASIFPRKDLGEKQSAVIAMISSHMEPGKVQIRS